MNVPFGNPPPPGTSDLEIIKGAFVPLANLAPMLLRGKVRGFIGGMTHADVKALYDSAGGEEGLQRVFEAIRRIGRRETIGVP